MPTTSLTPSSITSTSSLPVLSSDRPVNSGVRGWGIGPKLLAAFAVVAALAIAASGVAFHSYRTISHDLAVIENDSVPGMTHALVLARQAAALAASSSLLTFSANKDELNRALSSAKHRATAMIQSLDALSNTAVGRANAAKLRESVSEIIASTDKLAAAVANKLDMANERARLLEASSRSAP